MSEPVLLSCWVGPYRAVLTAARYDPEFGWAVCLGTTWYSWPLMGWQECDVRGMPLATPTLD